MFGIGVLGEKRLVLLPRIARRMIAFSLTSVRRAVVRLQSIQRTLLRRVRQNRLLRNVVVMDSVEAHPPSLYQSLVFSPILDPATHPLGKLPRDHGEFIWSSLL